MTQFRLIGPMQVLVDDQPVPLPGTAERALLALLLLSAGRTVPTSSLIDRLWSEGALPADPVNALQLRVSKLRRALAPRGGLVVRDATGYRADVDPDEVDVHRFAERITSARAAARSGRAEPDVVLAMYDDALRLWTADPLPDFTGAAWASVEAARLEQLHLAAVTERAETALALGRHSEIVADLEPVVAADPAQEGLAGLLMTALYGAGQQAAALDVYARTRRWLADELGLQPSAALRALHRRVLQQDERLAPPARRPPEPVPVLPPQVPPSASTISTASTASTASTLPARGTPLLGRDEAASAVARLLTEHRVVTLVGPGGAGKTSLALAVARQEEHRFDQRARLVRLGSLTTGGDVPLAVAEAVGVPLDGSDATTRVRDRLLGYLERQALLLVLDNCEHVVDGVARLVEAICARAPDVVILATSREALAVPGEVQYGVPPLDVPPEGTPAARVAEYPAARLFLDRARAVRSGLDPTDADLAALVRICARLDGMPLALELAAARASTLSITEIADRLHDTFRLLTTGPRTAEARQRTLRATVEWSHALLSPVERVVFRRLAVFHGGWTLDAAEAVVSGPDVDAEEVLDVLARLVERSMVVAAPGSPTRYRMLETLRQYAAEQLALHGEAEETARRHAHHLRLLVERADETLRGPGQQEALRVLRDEHANIRAALEWLQSDPARVDGALRLAGGLGLFWHLGRHLEGRAVLQRVVAMPGGSPAARARALQAVSLVERPRGCLVHPSPRCRETAAESLRLFLSTGDTRRAALSRALLAVELLDRSDPDQLEVQLQDAEQQLAAASDEWGQAVVAFIRLQGFLRRGDEVRSRATGRAAADAFRRLDDGWGLSAVLYHLGWGLRELGRYAEAVPVLEEAVEVATSTGMVNTAQWALGDLGTALLYLGDATAATERFERARAASKEVGDDAGEALATLGLAVRARIEGEASAARPLFADASVAFERLGTPLWRGQALAGLAWCEWRAERLDAALTRYDEVRRLGVAHGEPSLVATALEGEARVARTRGAEHDAARALATAAELRRRSTRPAPPHEQAELAGLELPSTVVTS